MRLIEKSPHKQPAELQSRSSDGPHGSRLGQLGEEAQRRGPGPGGGGLRLQLSSILRSMAANRWASEGSCIVAAADLHQSVSQTSRDFVPNIWFWFSRIPGPVVVTHQGPFVSVSRAERLQFRLVIQTQQTRPDCTFQNRKTQWKILFIEGDFPCVNW